METATGKIPIEKNAVRKTQLNIEPHLYKGVKPIEKNIIVTDMSGTPIGATYPKRAKGLVKSGRAEFISDCEIRLLMTHAPTVHINHTEDSDMSKIINFNAAEFIFDPSCPENVGTKMTVTDHTGQNLPVFEIGNWEWAWTQIMSEKKLEKNTDYVFRFAMELGINDTGDALSIFSICRDNDWNNRDNFPLSRSEYRPVLSKNGENGLLRVFEIPFNSQDAETTRFVFTAQHAVTRLLPPNDLSAYDGLPDLSYKEWWQARQEEMQAGTNNDAGQGKWNFRDNFLKNFLNNIRKDFGTDLEIDFGNTDSTSDYQNYANAHRPNTSVINLANATISEQTLQRILTQFSPNDPEHPYVLNLKGATIYSGEPQDAEEPDEPTEPEEPEEPEEPAEPTITFSW